jgi:hypothetical protein
MPLEIISEPKVKIDTSILHDLLTSAEEQGQVVLHILYHAPVFALMNIRIWPTTYLYDKHSSHKSQLVHAENIVMYPHWMPCIPGEKLVFTLIFTGLPKSCTIFDFVEVCDSEFGAFEARNISRNETDIYYLEMVNG